ncbi:MAG: histidine triad nucleotide-binding protein [Polyangiaceae bacterium]|nr:histidine triad nucleotide-binding protein [Polyangiaceae bacterium]
MTDCLFCKIAAHEIPAKLLHEDERVVAFADINPVAPVHALIIPRRHIATIDDVLESDESDMGHLFRVASLVASSLGLGEGGYRTVMNCGADAGQSVFHVHLHVLGGKPLGWPPFPK